MKAYRITEDMRIVRYGNRLRLELGNATIDDITDDDVSRTINMLIDIMHHPGYTVNEMQLRKRIPGSRFLTVKYPSARHDASEPSGLMLYVCNGDGTNISDMVCLGHPWQVTKLLTVLSGILLKLCEEGL